MKLSEIKAALRYGPYAWPGGYQMYFVASDGEVLSFKAVRENWRDIVSAHLTRNTRCGWFIDGVDINYEDPSLFCAHTNERIPSAYAEDEVV